MPNLDFTKEFCSEYIDLLLKHYTGTVAFECNSCLRKDTEQQTFGTRVHPFVNDPF